MPRCKLVRRKEVEAMRTGCHGDAHCDHHTVEDVHTLLTYVDQLHKDLEALERQMRQMYDDVADY